MKRTYEMIVSHDGTKLRLRRDLLEDAKGVMVICHGRGASMDTPQYTFMTDGFEGAGYSVYIFDHRGHGESEGPRGFYNDYPELIGDIKVMVDLAKAENPDKKIFLFGNSMGGFGTEVFACMYPGYVDGVILAVSAIPGKPEKPVKPDGDLTETIVINKKSSTGELEQNQRVLTSPGLEYAMANGWYWLWSNHQKLADPVLMLSAEKDEYFHPAEALALFNDIASTDKMLKIYGGSTHKLYGGPAGPEVLADTIAWLNVRSSRQ